MTVKEHLVKELDRLDEKQLDEMKNYLRFLKFRSRYNSFPEVDEKRMAKLYGEFAKEDRLLAEEGIADYPIGLKKEDEQ